MLKLILPVVGFCVVAAYSVQEYIKHIDQKPEAVTQQSTSPITTSQDLAAARAPKQVSEQPLYGRKTRLKMDSRGHFLTTAKMNGRNVEVLVDTGATSVAINKSTARRLGINLKKADFKYEVNTANGKTRAASTMIEKIQIGRVTVRNVSAAVLDDKALSSTLLGMSFLGQLKSFEVKNRELLLVQ